MSARRFGTEAMGDPCFAGSLARGRSLLKDIEAWASARCWTSLSQERGARKKKR